MPNGMLKNPLACHSERSEESLISFLSGTRFLASLGRTAIKRFSQHPVNGAACFYKPSRIFASSGSDEILGHAASG
jgi:hypothetical protein